jgi:hypothetical protein
MFLWFVLGFENGDRKIALKWMVVRIGGEWK